MLQIERLEKLETLQGESLPGGEVQRDGSENKLVGAYSWREVTEGDMALREKMGWRNGADRKRVLLRALIRRPSTENR
jgi:hypothetical protein